MTKIMPIDDPIPRGAFIGERVDGRRVHEADHYFKCPLCGGYFDARDRAYGDRREESGTQE